MTLSKLNIVRDCWWMGGSGTNYIVDENRQLSSYAHGLYKSLNSNDSQYIQFCGSGIYSSFYYGRLEAATTVPDRLIITARASGVAQGSWLDVTINNLSMGSFGNFTGLQNLTYNLDLTPAKKQRILAGRINDNYDYIGLRLTNSGVLSSTKLYNVDVWYSGGTWDNYTSGLPNVLSLSTYPNQLKFRSGSVWTNQNNTIVNGSGYYHINMPPTGVGVDNTYIRQQYPCNFILNNFNSRVGRNAIGPSGLNGGLSLFFDTSSVDPLTQVTRAQLTLRMSLPPSGQYENSRDTFEINGYNYRFADQDYKGDMPEEIGSIPKKASTYGYFTYGAGSIVEQSGFKNYTTELSFLDPTLSNGDIASTRYRNIDIFNNMEFKLVGIPSGTLLSAAQLYIEYLPNEDLALYTVGGIELKRAYVSSYTDIGGSVNPLFGDGAWHHRGNLNEGEIFDAFYRFDEVSGSSTYPISLNSASGCYGIYNNALYEYPVYDGEDIIDIDYELVPIDPTRKSYYRNPVRTEFGTAYDPTHYRGMIYNGSPFVAYDVHDPNASVYSSGIAQVYFEDRMVIGTDFTLYFMLYREPTNDGQNFAQIFHRGQIGSAGWTNYEVMGLLQTEDVTFIVRDVNDNTHQVSVDIPVATLEPILIWFTCSYDAENDETTIKLNVHTDIKRYFTTDWLHAEKTFPFSRKMYETGFSKTMLGPLYTPSDLDQQLAFTSFFSYVSLCEFGWADSAIDLSYNTASSDVINDYDISSDIDKKFLSSRLCNAEYLQGYNTDSDTIGGDPVSTSGWMSPQTTSDWHYDNLLRWWNGPGIKTAYDDSIAFHTLLSDVYWNGQPSDYLFGGNFNFNIPSGQIPVGIEARYFCYGTLNAVQVNIVNLLYNNGTLNYTALGTNQKTTGPGFFPSSAQRIVYGGTNNLWGLDTAGYSGEALRQLINDTNFGVGLKVNSFNYMTGTAYVDHLEVKVYTSGINTSTLSSFKHINWQVPNGSGEAKWSTQYAIDDWTYDSYQLFNPVTTAGTNNLVHQSAIYATVTYEHNTNHPSGAQLICDVEFDSGSTDNWKVCRIETSVPSGSLSSKTLTYTKHIGMYSEPINYADVSKICVNLTTKYADIGSQTYYGDLKITSLKVYFDSYSASATGVNLLNLYTEGTNATSNEDLFLYTCGNIVSTNDLDLYIYGIPYYGSGNIPLYIKAQPYTTAPLFIEGLTPNSGNSNLNLFTYATAAGVGGMYTKMGLYTHAMSPDYIPLYIHNTDIGTSNFAVPLYLQSSPLPTNTLSLYTVGPSGSNDTLYMYIRGLGTTDGAYPNNDRIPLFIARDSESIMNMLSLTVGQVGNNGLINMFIQGLGIPSSSIPLYVKGSGLPETARVKFYTHGY